LILKYFVLIRMTKIVGNLAYTAYVAVMLYYLYLSSYSQYVDKGRIKNYKDAQDTVISYTHATR
jgi:hypothetical protein